MAQAMHFKFILHKITAVFLEGFGDQCYTFVMFVPKMAIKTK
jgi:hypothetical protein